MAWEIITDYRTNLFKRSVQGMLKQGSGKVQLLIEKAVAGEVLYDEMGMQIVQNQERYCLIVLKNRYDRLEYENFLKQARDKGLDLGSNIWLTMQLTFPLEFWSVPKQNGILNKIVDQQFRFLAYILMQLK